ncbi:SymE family type I addiction module toxin [Thalassomonas haliotis]|uniref:Type I addiction module toxin, SymE family n=1 Tax=Thalassomonas haliotis TaxID=485448 RepID=A0ABY7VCY7_9GAMM|nr:SymE family type I addiction module toxin [Thalassomonas haliotis]WDE11525.1 type I addiction module toxin, SymE family [Thalassomonas haliotis]
MADYHHTPEPRSAKAKYPLTRKLTILETICAPAVRKKGPGFHYTPVNLQPCIFLQGKWLRQAGFPIGGKVVVTVNQGQLTITPAKLPPVSGTGSGQ